MKYALPLDELSLDRVAEVGGKTASLGEMVRTLKGAGVRVPDGFALTVAACSESYTGRFLQALLK